MQNFLVLLAGAALVAPVWADGPPGTRTITTSGAATVYVKPDIARIHYGIRVTEPSPDAAKDVLGKLGKTMDEAITKLKLTSMKITTGPVTIRQAGANGLGGIAIGGGGVGGAPGMGMMQPFIGQSSHTATITDSDPEKLRAAIDAFVKAVTENGANSSGGDDRGDNPFIGIGGQDQGGGPKIVLSRSDESAAREEALQKATEKAMKSAKVLAKALGGGEVKVLSVTDVEPEAAAGQNITSFLMEMKPDGPKAPAGEIEVKVRVTLKVSY